VDPVVTRERWMEDRDLSGQGGAAPPPVTGGSGMSWMFIMLIMMFVLISPGPRAILGGAFSVAFNPIIGFGGTAPVWSIFLGTVIMMSISQTIRGKMTPWVKVAKNQQYMKAFQKEVSEARKEARETGRDVRLRKLMEIQPQVMSRQMETQGQQMKPSIFTMALFIAFITWIYALLDIAAVPDIATPWNPSLVIAGARSIFSPAILIYFCFTIPLSQVILNMWKYIYFSKRLRELKAEEVPEVLA